MDENYLYFQFEYCKLNFQCLSRQKLIITFAKVILNFQKMGRKLFKWEGLYKTWSSDDPRSFILSEEEKTDSRTTEQMIEDALVNVPEVPEDEVSKTIGEMNEV